LNYHRRFRPNLERGSNSEGKGGKHDDLCHGRIPSKAVPQPTYQSPELGALTLAGKSPRHITGNTLFKEGDDEKDRGWRKRRQIRRNFPPRGAEEDKTNKMTLYRHFTSKDELVAQYLQRLAEKAKSSWDRLEADYPGNPTKQLRAGDGRSRGEREGAWMPISKCRRRTA
jgi:hypothetical protein